VSSFPGPVGSALGADGSRSLAASPPDEGEAPPQPRGRARSPEPGLTFGERVFVRFDEVGEIEAYTLLGPSSLAVVMAEQLRRDDEVKHVLRLGGIDPLALSYEERQRAVLGIDREELF